MSHPPRFTDDFQGHSFTLLLVAMIPPVALLNMIINTLLSSTTKRFLIASLVWLVFWPILWFFKIGDITGPKAWFWIVGELSYPIVAVVYLLLDFLLARFIVKPVGIFLGAVLIIAALMPFYYERYGFRLGVSVEARYL